MHDVLISTGYSVDASNYIKLSAGLPAEQGCIDVRQDVNSRMHSSTMVFKRSLERAPNLETSAIRPMKRPIRLLQCTRILLRAQSPVMFDRYAVNVSTVVRLHKEGS